MNTERACNKCSIRKPFAEYRYHADKKWLSRVCKQCERDGNQKSREKVKLASLTLVDEKKLCTSCQTYKETKQFESLDMFRPKECLTCIICRKKQQVYTVENKDRIDTRSKEYYQTNHSYIRQQRKDFRSANREAHNKRQRSRYHTDSGYRLASNLRRRARKLLGKGRKHDENLGCDGNFFNDWISYNLQFSSTMTWNNYGTYWHADHVFPCANFTLTFENHRKVCFNWMNYSPLEARLNQSKLNRIDINQVKLHNQRLAEFLKLKNFEVVTWDPFNVLQQPQLPPFNGNIKDEQVETVLEIDSRPSEGKNIEDEESDYDSELEDEFIEKLISDSEIGNPQQVLPDTSLTFNNILQLDDIKR